MKKPITWDRSQMGFQSGWTPSCYISIWHADGRYQVEVETIPGETFRAPEGFRTQREARRWAEGLFAEGAKP